MDFRTEVVPQKGFEGVVSHSTPLLLLGSCFTDNIGALLVDSGFDATVNPFGPLYNPLSLLRAFRTLSAGQPFTSADIFASSGSLRSFDFHSRFSRADASEALEAMNTSLAKGVAALRKAAVVIITLGTTRFFSRRDNGDVVANCHKLHPSVFDEMRLSLPRCEEALTLIVETIRGVNPDAAVMFTISPLRYLGSGAHDNLIIKSTLALAVDSVMSRCDNILYFPAYEIMLDDLRDYRFYAADMRHPSDVAVEYIFSRFMLTYCSEPSRARAADCRRASRRAAHRDIISL